MIAYISQNAFWGLLISAVEVYKRECFGLLIGYRDRRGPEDMYIVEHALPYQTAGRRHKGVVLRQIMRSKGRATQQFRNEFRPVLVWQGVELVEQLLGGLRHRLRVAPSALGVKFPW